MSSALLGATFLAGFLYVISPGPAFLALFALTASEGRGAGARFVAGHLGGDLFWGFLSLAAIIGVSRIGSALFDVLGFACGLYLLWLGAKALLSPRTAHAEPVGKRRPFVTGALFGLTNPKAYPVALAMFTALTAAFASDLRWSDSPQMMGAAFIGFVAADAVLIFMAGLPVVRRFFLRHGQRVTRLVGVMFIAFGAKSMLDAGRSLSTRS